MDLLAMNNMFCLETCKSRFHELQNIRAISECSLCKHVGRQVGKQVTTVQRKGRCGFPRLSDIFLALGLVEASDILS